MGEILRITKLTQAQLKLLNRENISYFKTLPQGSLNDAIRSQYFNQATKVQMESDVLEKGELLLTVSKLMEAEWRILFQYELSSEVLVDVVIEILLHQVPQLTYHIVLALCGHLQPTWPNVLQLLRLLVYVEPGDTRELLWISVHSNLVKLREVAETKEEDCEDNVRRV